MDTNPLEGKTRADLIADIQGLRRQLAQAEKTAAECRQALDGVGVSETGGDARCDVPASAPAEQGFRSIVENLDDVLFTLTPDGAFSYVSPQWQAAFGHQLSDLVGQRFEFFVHPDDRPGWLGFMRQVLATGAKQSGIEYRALCQDGSQRWYKVTASLIASAADGRPTLVGIGHDVTERRQVEDALRESEERLRSFLENVPVGIFVSSRDGKFSYVNPALPVIMGYDSCAEMMAAVNHKSIAEVLYVEPTQRPALVDELDRSHHHWLSYEGRYRRKDGQIIDAAISIGQKLDKSTNEPRFYGIVNDITARKRTEAELIAARQTAESASLAKTRFLAAASHDLRQPIQAISLFNDALLKAGLGAEPRRIANHLAQSVNSLRELLNALLDISRLDAGAVRPCFEVIDVTDLFTRIDAELSGLAVDKSLRFKLCFPFRGMALNTDTKLLMSLLGNLVGNAIKYTRAGGILIAVRRRGDQALIQVWDTGVGVASEDMSNIFEEFFQIGNPQRDRSKGLGLGLAIARRLARLLDTEVVCRSRLGRGSVFEFYVPLAPPLEQTAPGSTADLNDDAGTANALRGRRVVVIEDDVMVAEALQMALELFGMNITRYGSAEEALADAAIAAADFYISDLRLPGANGIQLLDAIQLRTMRPLKALVLTGDTSPERIETTQASRWTVLFKPIDLPRLLAAIEAQVAVR